jgi:phosphoadenosine phosphosulfate reductase
MSGNVLSSGRAVLQEARSLSNKALVAFSGGKDSRVIMDMACRTFDHVEGFYMFFAPGIQFIQEQLDFATERWGVRIHLVPHWSAINALKYGVYCDAPASRDSWPDVKILDMYGAMMRETGIPVLLTGAKKADSGWRRRDMRRNARREAVTGKREVFCPLADWTKFDVLAYLRANSIPLPDAFGVKASGVDLVTHEMLWMHDHYPDDFKRLCRVFPYAEAVVWRRNFYG